MKNKKALLFGLLVGLIISIIITSTFLFQPTASPNIKVINDRDYFPAVHEALKNAKTSIHAVQFELTYYAAYNDSNMNTIIQDLIDAKKRGVDVKIVVDEFGNKLGKDITTKTMIYLKKNGVADTKLDSNKVTTHAKLFIIDGKIVVIGSTNLTHTAIDLNHEADVIIYSKEVAQEFESYFKKRWDGS